MFNKLLGAGRCKIIITAHPSQPMMAVVAMRISSSWWKHKAWMLDMISFLLLTEQLSEVTDYSKDFVFKIRDKSITIPTYALRTVQRETASIGPEVYEVLKNIDKMVDQMSEQMLKSNVLSEEAKKQITERESLMSAYRREHAKMKGYDPMVYIAGNDSVN